jgi:hypothetical protein
MISASVFSRLTFRQWFGPLLAGPQAYVISDTVPQGWKWRLFAASILALNGYTSRTVYLFAIPPYLARVVTNTSQLPDKGIFFAGNGNGLGTSANNPPLKGAVLLSEGGAGPDIQMVISAGGGLQGTGSVNLLQVARLSTREFSLPPDWALLGYINGFGGTGMLELNALILPVPLKGGF